MQFNARHAAGYTVEKFRRQVFGHSIIKAFLFPSAYEVVLFFADHMHQLRDLIGAILQVGVHSDHHRSDSGFETLIQCRTLSVVTLEFNAFDIRIGAA
ncbi:hypothetical protein D3C87_1444370 [compost metagenome]